MKDKLYKILLSIVGVLIIILVAMLANYYLENDSNTSLNNKTSATADNSFDADSNQLIKNARSSKKLDYKNLMTCKNKETRKGCILENNNNQLILYNKSIKSEQDFETLEIEVLLNGKKLDVFNEPLTNKEIKLAALNDDGVYFVKEGANVCEKTLYVFKTDGTIVESDFGDYNLCNVTNVNGKITLELNHKMINNSPNYVCDEHDTNYIATQSDVDVKIVYLPTVTDEGLKLNMISSVKYSAFCANNKGE